MTFRITLRLLALGCIALFCVSIYLHWQAGLLASVAFSTVAAIAGLSPVKRETRDDLCVRAAAHAAGGAALC